MPNNVNFLSSEMYAAIAGAIITFLLTIAWQYFAERRNKIQLTYSKKIESPLSIPKNELKDKLKIYYDHDEIKDIFYAKLSIKNIGQRTVKKQIFRCEFDQNIKSIDRKFPLITTNPEKEILVEKVFDENQNGFQSNVFRYQIEALAPEQSVQIDFLFDGSQKDFGVSFRPNQIDEVKIFEGSLSSDPNLESYVIQFGLNLMTAIFLLFASVPLGLTGIIFMAAAIPFLYSAFAAFRKLVPLFLENVIKNEKQDYHIDVGNEARSHIVIGDGSINVTPEKYEDNEDEHQPNSLAVFGEGSINIKSGAKKVANKNRTVSRKNRSNSGNKNTKRTRNKK